MDKSTSGNRQIVNRGGRENGRGRGRGRKDPQQGKKIINQDSRNDKYSSQKLLSENCEDRDTATTSSAPLGKLSSRKPADALSNDTETCIICASEIIHESFGPCNHRTCHICSIRMRVLFKDKTCTLCRTPAPFIIITDNRLKRFEEYSDDYFKKLNFQSIDDNIGLRFDSAKIREDTLWMLGYNCPDKECNTACLAWTHLHDHTRRAHGKKICDLCSKNRKIFPHEHKLFTDSELSRHMKKGDSIPGAVNQSGFKGHPLCSFCGNRFFGDDELFKHLREKHEKCFVCDRANPGEPPSYYVNYEALRQHLVDDHYVCKMKDCLDQKYIAFISEFELKTHMLEVHGESLSKDVRRDVRIVNISDFSYRQPYAQEMRQVSHERSNRGRRIGRDPTVEISSAVTSQSIPRDEQAFQRQLAAHSAQSVTTRNVGNQHTAAPSSKTQVSQSRVTTSRQLPEYLDAVTSRTLNNSAPPHGDNITSQERVRSLKFMAIDERASTLLQKDSLKLSRFKSFVAAYIDGSMTAAALIEFFLSLFSNTSSNSLGTLIREISDLTKDTKRAEDLRTAWNNFRAINEDYPSLPVASSSNDGSIPLNWVAKNGNASSSGVNLQTSSVRVMKLKKIATHPGNSSTSHLRSSNSTPASSSQLSSESNTRVNDSLSSFKNLPPSSANKNLSGARKVSNKPWASKLSSASSSTVSNENYSGPSIRPTYLSGGRISGVVMGTEAFPALPNIAKPQGSVIQFGNNKIKKIGSTPVENVWRENGESSSVGEGEQGNANKGKEEGREKRTRKGNKEKKHVLMGWG
ncbi:E3 ubiquitin-protein ligase hel2 [Golovinomyces cichoracearum]|uniref:RING-type E3 ubiquitin transferase n=1 Tax=Golovinomyces cichoracearum TaxID=62708 RepID=A0A420HBZ5_9PEZI|nr:E3 ubiquitin-protein ligase hel2 [Golovinomyces cichoracearum]